MACPSHHCSVCQGEVRMANTPTHRVTVVVTSVNGEPEVHMEVQWEPLLSDDEIKDLGYIPAAYQFVDAALMTAAWMAVGKAEIEEEDLSNDRVIN